MNSIYTIRILEKSDQTPKSGLVWLVIIIGLCIIGLIIYHKKIKKLNCDNVNLITGGVKSGKTALTVATALRDYKKRYKKYKRQKWIIEKIWNKLFKKNQKDIPEEPLLYSNVPLNCDFVPLTIDLVLRKKRFAYGSVVIVSESSLLADSMDYKDEETNYILSKFNKLFGHETWGGTLYYETQSIQDNHFSVKRSLNHYFWIYAKIKIPFFMLLKVRDFYYQDGDSSITNTITNQDIEDTKWIIISKKVFKMYDRYSLSKETDNLEIENEIVHGKELPDLKTDKIVSIKEYIKTKKKKGGK